MVIGEIEAHLKTLIHFYNPPGKGDELLKRVLQLQMMEAQVITILGGDFNLVMHQKADPE